MATSLLMEISQDEKERARYRSRRMAETDYDSNMLASRRDERQKIARVMKAKGISISDIIECTGLTVDEIIQLK